MSTPAERQPDPPADLKSFLDEQDVQYLEGAMDDENLHVVQVLFDQWRDRELAAKLVAELRTLLPDIRPGLALSVALARIVDDDNT